MENKIKNIIAAAVVLFVAVAAPVFADTPRLSEFAPVGTDAIIGINCSKIFNTKLFKAFQKTAEYEDIVKDAAKNGADLEQALRTARGCVFVNVNFLMRDKDDAFSIIYRTEGAEAAAIFELIRNAEKKAYDSDIAYIRKQDAKEDFDVIPKFTAYTVDGKPAFAHVDESVNIAAILMDQNTLQVSWGFRAGAMLLSPLTRGPAAKLTDAVDPEALVSVAWQVQIPSRFFTEMGDAPEVKLSADILTGLEVATLNVYDAGEFLEFRAIGTYKSEERAQQAYETILALRQIALTTLARGEDPEAKATLAFLKQLAFSRDGSKIVASAKYDQNEFVKFIEDRDKEDRESARKLKESKKEEESPKREAPEK